MTDRTAYDILEGLMASDIVAPHHEDAARRIIQRGLSHLLAKLAKVESDRLEDMADVVRQACGCSDGTVYGWSLGAVARANIYKLADRAARGQIHGEGDTR